MFEASVKFEAELGPEALARLSLIALHLGRLVNQLEIITFRRVTSIELNLPGTEGGTMPFSYKADKPDFVSTVTIQGVDSEGNTLKDINIPTGMTLAVVSSDLLGLAITPDPVNPKAFGVHVGEPNDDESPRPVTVTATLTRDSDGSTVATISESGEVTVGDAVGDPTALGLGLPTS